VNGGEGGGASQTRMSWGFGGQIGRVKEGGERNLGRDPYLRQIPSRRTDREKSFGRQLKMRVGRRKKEIESYDLPALQGRRDEIKRTIFPRGHTAVAHPSKEKRKPGKQG